MKTRREASRFASFVVTGGIAAAVNVGSRYLLSQAMSYGAAVAVAYVIGMTTAYLLARRYVFDGRGGSWLPAYLRFALVNVAAFIQVWVVSVGLAEYGFPRLGFTWHAEDIAHVIGVVSPVLTSYYLHKHFSFRGHRVAEEVVQSGLPADEALPVRPGGRSM